MKVKNKKLLNHKREPCLSTRMDNSSQFSKLNTQTTNSP